MLAAFRTRIFGILCLCALGMLFVHAIDAAVFPDEVSACESADGHRHDAPEGDCATPGCCHGHCPTVFLDLDRPVEARIGVVQELIQAPEGFAPEAPAREIEFPPQLP